MTLRLNRFLTLSAIALLWSGLSLPATAHNGALAIAVPVEGIKVDGDLSDWPVEMRRYPIALFADGSDRPKDTMDFQGDFRVGYNERENTLYFAVEMQDESVVLLPDTFFIH